MDKDTKIDCKRIQHIANKHGIKLNLNECEKLWRDFSEEEFSAGWMDLNIFDLDKILVPLFKKLPCKYCDLKNYIKAPSSWNVLLHEIDVESANAIYLKYFIKSKTFAICCIQESSNEFEINYCPFCGRRLEDEE